MGRQLRTCLDQVISDLTKHVQDVQDSQKYYHDKQTRHRNSAMGYRILLHNYPTLSHYVAIAIGYIMICTYFEVINEYNSMCMIHQQ